VKAIPALSLTVPWPWAIFDCGKGGTAEDCGIENRQAWDSCNYRGPLLVHASNPPPLVLAWWKRKRVDPAYKGTDKQIEEVDEFNDLVHDILDLAKQNGVTPPRITLRELLEMAGHIVGTVEVVGVVRKYAGSGPGSAAQHQGRGIAEIGTERRWLTEHEARWWMGGFGLVLRNPRKFVVPVPCRGAQKLWTPPVEVLDACRAALPADYAGAP